MLWFNDTSFFRAAQNKRIELSDLKAGAQSRPGSSSKRELHGWDAHTRQCLCNRVQWCWRRYDGPLQYLAQTGNPDSAMTTVQVGVKQKYQNIFQTVNHCTFHLRRERSFNDNLTFKWVGGWVSMSIYSENRSTIQNDFRVFKKPTFVPLTCYSHSR